MRDVRRPDETEPLVDLLTNPKRSEHGEPVFQTIMDLLIFAAAVGFRAKETQSVPSSAKAIPYAIFERNQKDGYIHLLALASAQSPETLGNKEAENSVQIFEEYCAGGLRVIQKWLNENPSDVYGVETIMSKIADEMSRETATPVRRPSPI